MAMRLPERSSGVVADTSASWRPTSTRRFSRYGCEKISERSRSASFHTAALPSNRLESSVGVNCEALTIVVLEARLTRPSASSTRSSAKRGCRGALVNGGHAVETSRSGGGPAAAISNGAEHASTMMKGRIARAKRNRASRERIDGPPAVRCSGGLLAGLHHPGLRRRGEPVVFRDDLGRGGIEDVIRRHDLHAVLVEEILDVRVQLGEHDQAHLLPLQAHQQRVLDVEILERRLDN